jgi:hypothetical protein
MVGDVALIKLLPKKAGDEFPFAALGNSDKVKEGDWSLAMGNPFLLATDFTPTVTFGLVSGVHRYQPPEGKGFLEYCDCIQIDTSINPGNSGGPLFNLDGEVIGINGRGSFDKRGRVNSGVGYAISINQIKHFMGHLKGGLNADHATLGARPTTQTEKDGYPRLVVTTMLDDCDVMRRGLQYDDEIVSFDGRPTNNANQFLNAIGVYPRGWRLPMVYRRKNDLKEILVRLMGATAKEVEKKDAKGQPIPQPKPGIQPIPVDGGASPAGKYYEPKKGFVNHYFNKLEKDRVLQGFKKHGDFSKMTGDWTFLGDIRFKQLKDKTQVRLEVRTEKAEKGGTKPVASMTIGKLALSPVEPLDVNATVEDLQQPKDSGGLMLAMYLYKKFLNQGEAGMAKCFYAGKFPYYPPLPEGKIPDNWAKVKKLADVIETEVGNYHTKWYFSTEDQKLMAFEVTIHTPQSDDESGNPPDPCEVYLGYDQPVNGAKGLPNQMHVRFGTGATGITNIYGNITITNADLGDAKAGN